MSCLLKRYNGYYYIVTTKRGRRIWLSLRTRDEVEAREAFDRLEAERKRKVALKVSLFASDFAKRASLSLHSKTIAMYASAFRNFIRITGDRTMKNVTPLQIEEFKGKRVEEIAPVSVNIELRSLRAAFNEARRLRLIEENPFDGVKLVREPYCEAPWLSEEELNGLLDSIAEREFKDLVTFALFTMMRVGEIVHLRWGDVDLQKRRVYVKHHGEARVKGGKERVIPMADWVYAFLVTKVRCCEFVFTSPRARPCNAQWLSRKFKKCVREYLGARDRVHFHSLRHSAISWLINQGVPIELVQQIAGHGSFDVTRIYTHFEDRNLAAAINTFNRFPGVGATPSS